MTRASRSPTSTRGSPTLNSAFLQHSGYSRDEVIGRNSRLLQSGQTPRETYRALWDARARCHLAGASSSTGARTAASTSSWPPSRPAPSGRAGDALRGREGGRRGAQAHRSGTRQLSAPPRATGGRPHRRARAITATGRVREPRKDGLPGQHEPRDPHADERDPGLHALAAARRASRRSRCSGWTRSESAGTHLLTGSSTTSSTCRRSRPASSNSKCDFTLEAVLGHVATLIGERSAAKGLELRVEGDDGEAWVRGDLTRLRQALLNLASNAVKFTERQHRLACATGRVAARCYLARFEVEDTGVGIAPDVLLRAVQAFQQATARTCTRWAARAWGSPSRGSWHVQWERPAPTALRASAASSGSRRGWSTAPPRPRARRPRRGGPAAATRGQARPGRRGPSDQPRVATDLLQAAGLAVATADQTVRRHWSRSGTGAST